jgi:hypothetical protein
MPASWDRNGARAKILKGIGGMRMITSQIVGERKSLSGFLFEICHF